ncbi:hypothetical protein EIP91_007835 [Steccherinum ochraceum]|uniref:NADH:ubiquinone oxidoreductase intermediate-associated protein 30 domain-containing protein n=1 Tax=Steccherinum ochraceum TaxID=92696 RepID=A0A4R0R9F0_9APHY|nr:hypothetical protein EIP91_007835 [Steccherinum ochraceum]
MSRLSLFLNRSSKLLRDNSSKILRMQGADEPSRAPKLLFEFNAKEAVEQFATGCDADIGGTSSVHFELNETPTKPEGLAALAGANYSPRPTAKFWGEMRLGVRPELREQIRGGYAGFRSKARYMFCFHGVNADYVSLHEYLALRMRAGGSPRTRNSYYVNIQTDGPVTTDLWQHRLFFHRDDGEWEDVFVPFNRFVLTNSGEIQPEQLEMFRERVRTVGISLLGGNNGIEGPYELEIDSIRAVNEEDVTAPVPNNEVTDGTQWQRHAV